MANVYPLRKQKPKMQCLGCGEISTAPCECDVGWKAIVDEYEANEAERKEKHRAVNRESMRRKREQNQRPVDIHKDKIDQSDWTDEELEEDGGPLSTMSDDRRNDLLGLAEMSTRAEHVDLQGVKATSELMEAVDEVIAIWTNIREKLECKRRARGQR